MSEENKLKKLGVIAHNCIHSVGSFNGQYSIFWTPKTREKLVDAGYLIVCGECVQLERKGFDYTQEHAK